MASCLRSAAGGVVRKAQAGRRVIRLEGFNPAEVEMLRAAEAALQSAGYNTSPLQVLVRVEMPTGYRGMTLADGAALSGAAFGSQAMLNHVLEEELLHHQQKAAGEAGEFQPGTARILEGNIDRKSTRLNSSHIQKSRMPSSA